MHQTDLDRRQFIARHFKRDLDDPRLYDLVFNTDYLTVDRIVAAILTVTGMPMMLTPA